LNILLAVLTGDSQDIRYVCLNGYGLSVFFGEALFLSAFSKKLLSDEMLDILFVVREWLSFI
jgi:hypothetical protein